MKKSICSARCLQQEVILPPGQAHADFTSHMDTCISELLTAVNTVVPFPSPLQQAEHVRAAVKLLARIEDLHGVVNGKWNAYEKLLLHREFVEEVQKSDGRVSGEPLPPLDNPVDAHACVPSAKTLRKVQARRDRPKAMENVKIFKKPASNAKGAKIFKKPASKPSNAAKT
jgi:hypothetical protein